MLAQKLWGNGTKFIAYSLVVFVIVAGYIGIHNKDLFETKKASQSAAAPYIDSGNKNLNTKALGNNENLSRIVYDISVELDMKESNARITSEFTYQNTGNTSIYFIVQSIDISTLLTDSKISTILVFDTTGPLFFDWVINENQHIINITLRTPLLGLDFYSFSLTYLLEEAIITSAISEDQFILLWSIIHDDNTEQFNVYITLPKDYILSNESATPPLDPLPTYQSPDNQRFEWSYSNIIIGFVQAWTVRFQLFEDNTVPGEPVFIYLWGGMIGTFFGGLILGAVGMFIITKTRTDSERKEMVENLLSEPEKDLLKIVQTLGGTPTQSKICTESGFSKAKVSYYLGQLEDKGIIIRERFGRMNRVKIIDEAFEKTVFDNNQEEE